MEYNKSQIFENVEFGKLEVLMIDDKPYFPATECARILGYKNPHDAISKHCKRDGVAKREGVSFTTNQHGTATGQTVEKTYISEGNLYRLIIRSKLPAATRFETWIFDYVIPTIRKYGAYLTDDMLKQTINNPEFCIQLLQALQNEREKNTAMEMQISTLAPKARYYDMVMQSKSVVPVSLISKDYGMSAVAFNRLLNKLKIQYKAGRAWILYQAYADKGYTVSRTYAIDDEQTVIQTLWSQKGRLFLYEFLRDVGIVPMCEQNTQKAKEELKFIKSVK